MDADQWAALNEMLIKPQPSEGGASLMEGSTELTAAALQQQQQPLYTQSVLRPDLLQGTAAAEGGMVWEGGEGGYTEGAAEDKLYAVVDGVVYEVALNEEGEQVLVPAQQENGVPLSLEDLAAATGQQPEAAAAAAVPDQQQYVGQGVVGEGGDAGVGGGVATTVVDSNGQEYVVMQSEAGEDAATAAALQAGAAIKVGGQDYVLPPGMQLPAELQEMIAKGLPIDLSNYEFVIEGATAGSTEQYDGSAVTTTAGVQYVDASGNHVSAQSVVNPNDVLSMLAEASSAVARRDQRTTAPVPTVTRQWTAPGASPVISDNKKQQQEEQRQQLVAAMFSADENEDGEFDYVTGSVPNGAGVVIVAPAPRSSGYLESFVGFVNGNRAETLSSLASSTVVRRAPVVMPSYGRTIPTPRGGSSVGRGGMMRGGVSGRGRGRPPAGGRGMQVSVTPFTVQSPHKESSIIQRKRKGSDTDSDGGLDEEDGVEGGMIRRAAGDGRMSGYILEVGPHSTNKASVVYDDKGEPHQYEKGDFVIEWKDTYRAGGFPIWKIESGRLLQKYDPLERDGVLLHKSASIYSSWSGDIRQSFKAIQVEMITSTGRRQELVRVLEQYLPKHHDENLESDPLMELFNVYTQSLMSEALEPNFLANARQQQEEYYLGPLSQLDTLLEEAEKSALGYVQWNDRFKVYADQFPQYSMTPISGDKVNCSAWTGNDRMTAVQTVQFYGQSYDRDTLANLDNIPNVTLPQAEAHAIGSTTAEHLPTYHALHHFKYHLFNKCKREIQYRKQGGNKPGSALLEECLQNRVWIQQNLLELKELLQKCSIVVTVVSKPEEAS